MHRHMVAPLISLSVTALLICLVGALYGTSDDDTKNSRSSKRWAVKYSHIVKALNNSIHQNKHP